MRYAFLFFSFLLLTPLASHASDDRAVLAEINLARTHPQAYATILKARMSEIGAADRRSIDEAVNFLNHQRPLDPLQCVQALAASARQHVDDEGPVGAIGHRGTDGRSPYARMSAAGQWVGRAGENISYGYADGRSIVASLIVDQGVPGRGHRRNIFRPDFKVAGAACGPHARYGSMCVIDFADGFAEKGEKIAMVDQAWRSFGGY